MNHRWSLLICLVVLTAGTGSHALLVSQFSAAMAQGRIEWKVADFQKETDLSKRFGAVTNCVVLVHVQGGKEVAFQRLDEISSLMDDAAAYETYVADAIRNYLP